MKKAAVLLLKTSLIGLVFWTGTAALAKDNLIATQAWVRPTVPGQEVTGAFMNLQSPSHAKLIKAESPSAEIVQLHSMAMHNNVMEMREIKELDLPAGKTVKLAPGGLHIMLINVKKPLRQGDTVPLKLTIQNDDKSISVVEVDAPVGLPK